MWVPQVNNNEQCYWSSHHDRQTYPSYRLRAALRRDMFNIGQTSEVSHFNGVSWYLYPDLKAINNGFAWFYGVHPTKDFVLIGGVSLTALNGFPVVIREYC